MKRLTAVLCTPWCAWFFKQQTILQMIVAHHIIDGWSHIHTCTCYGDTYTHVRVMVTHTHMYMLWSHTHMYVLCMHTEREWRGHVWLCYDLHSFCMYMLVFVHTDILHVFVINHGCCLDTESTLIFHNRCSGVAIHPIYWPPESGNFLSRPRKWKAKLTSSLHYWKDRCVYASNISCHMSFLSIFQDGPEWLRIEDWILIKVVITFLNNMTVYVLVQGLTSVLEFPLSLTATIPAQMPNWSILSDITSSLGKLRRSPLQVMKPCCHQLTLYCGMLFSARIIWWLLSFHARSNFIGYVGTNMLTQQVIFSLLPSASWRESTKVSWQSDKEGG